MKLSEYNIEAFKFIRSEINLRLQIHYKLVMWKIALGGGIIVFLIDKQEALPVSPFLISAIFLFLMDIVIVENLGHIRSAGQFIKKNVENYEEKDDIIKWEGDFAQMDDKWHCFSAIWYIFGIWIIAPMLIIGDFFTPLIDKGNYIYIGTLLFSIYLAFFSFSLIFKELRSVRKIKIRPSKSPIH